MKDKLVNKDWKNLKELQSLSAQLDARERERQFEKEQEAKIRGHSTASTLPPRRDDGTFASTKAPAWNTIPRSAPPGSSSTPSSAMTPSDGSTPMELDAQRLQPLSEATRQQCRDEGRCFRCRKMGHRWENCRAPPSKVFVTEVQLSENDSGQE
jgi:hypothetical protein